MQRSRLDTEAPLRRIFWEQAIQPFALGGIDLYHALAFVAPLALTDPVGRHHPRPQLHSLPGSGCPPPAACICAC